MLYTKPLIKLSRKDVAIAGGKGASLGELMRTGVSVPNGFVVLANSSNLFIKEAGLQQEIRIQLNKVDKDKVRTATRASKRIQSMILRAKIPQEIIDAITKDFSTLNAKYVAVRSSATAEDSKLATWAGQLDTYLNTTEKTLLENVQKCCASLYTTRAIFYRLEHGLKDSNVSVAVVVQEMIESEKAGVAFSVHPVTKDKNQIVIEAGFGLGEAVVSGLITPNAYVVSKKNNKIIDTTIHKQTKALYRKNNGGNKWVGLGVKGEKQVLNKKNILKLSEIIKKIEKHYKTPQDIEWAFAKNKFYIMQSRAITTFSQDTAGVTDLKYSHILASKRIILSLLAMETWQKSEKISQKFGYKKIRNAPFFLHEKDKEYRVYYKNNYYAYMNKQSYISNVAKLNRFSKIFLESNKELEKLIVNINDIKPVDILERISEIFALTDYFFFIRSEKNLALFTSREQEKIIKLRSYSEKIIHNAFTFILEGANEIMHTVNKSTDSFKKNVYLADYITKSDLIIVLGRDKHNIKDITKKAKENATAEYFVYHNSNIYINSEALKIIEKHVGLKNKNLFAYKSEKIGNVLHGSTAVIGYVEGKAIVIKNWQDGYKINEAIGDIILVCPDLTPEISSGFNMDKIRGMIVETGSTLCHAAIVAREHNKPTAISVSGSGDLIHDGMSLKLDAQKTFSKIYYT